MVSIKKKLKQVHNAEQGIEEDDNGNEKFDGRSIQQNEWEKDDPQLQLIELAAILNITQVNKNFCRIFSKIKIFIRI